MWGEKDIKPDNKMYSSVKNITDLQSIKTKHCFLLLSF